MDSIGMFEAAVAGEDEQRLEKQAQADKLAAAVYDVRERHGQYLFGATDLDGFNDRAKLAFVSICETIEPHMHARTGVYRRVMKAMEREWRERQACYPGCHENEAHAKKFHKDKGGDDEKEARRQAGKPVHEDPDRAHRILDRAHEMVDERSVPQGTQGPLGAGEGPRDPVGGLGPDYVYGDPRGSASNEDPYAGDPIGDLMQSPLGQHFQEEGPSFGRPVSDEQHWASNRYAEFDEHAPDHPELHTQETFQDHQGEELVPEGNFDSYKDSVDQGAPSKVDHDFTNPDPRSSSPYEVHEHNESGDHNFVPKVTGSRYPEYEHIARMLYATGDPTAMPAGGSTATGPGADMGTPPADPGMGAGMAPPAPVTSTPAGSGAPVTPPMTPTASREYQLISAMLRQGGGVNCPSCGKYLHDEVARAGHAHGPNGEVYDADPQYSHESRDEYMDRGQGGLPPIHTGGLKYADRNYLQQADEALTKVLNEKAEEFQNTIAPLQQALITIQQAEQLTNPLNVSPPAGTVNVLPQGAQGNQAPQGQGGLGADPAAAGLAAGGGGLPAPDPNQQMQARRKRGGQGKGEARQAGQRRADVVQDFTNWVKKSPGLPTGGEVDVDNFAEQKHKGPRAIQKLKQQQGISVGEAPAAAAPTLPKAPASSPGGASNYGIKARSKKAQKPLIAEPNYIWSKSPSTVHAEFANRMGKGSHPDDVYRQLLAEITAHYDRGEIDNRDAHRAANEAFGRLLMSRKHRAETYHGEGEVEDKSGPFAGPHGSFPVGTPKDLADAKSVCNNPSVSGKHPGTCDKVEHMQKPARRKQAWQVWGPDTSPKRHKVADWTWDQHLNGYVSTSARHFA